MTRPSPQWMANPGFWALGAGLGMVWWLAIRMLWNEWQVDPQYGYGFLVPVLCVVLFIQRWRDRPKPTAPKAARGAVVIALLLLFYLLAVPPFFEANPEWRILGITGALSATALTLLLVYGLGGKAWGRHFLFPVLFFWIAIPWPRNLEEVVMGYLMEHNAIAALEVLHWCGVAAARSGHLIALPTGMIGVEEACSGVRSLQSGIMAALFLGEIFRFGWFSRSVLVSCAIAISLAGNFLRATTLSLLASKSGIEAIETWHDTAGFLILGSTLGGIWLLAYWWSSRRGGKMVDPVSIAHAGMIRHQQKLGILGAFVFLAGCASLVGTEYWYRSREVQSTPQESWAIKSGSPGTQSVAVSDRTRRILFFPEGFSERFVDPSGLRWQMFYFRWPPGQTAIQAVGIHDPKTCLTSIGMELEEQLPTVEVKVKGVVFPFRVFLFRSQDRPVLVFHAILSDGNKHRAGAQKAELDYATADYSLMGRVNMMMMGIRNSGQTVVEAAVWGTTDVNQAKESLAGYLKRSLIKFPQKTDG